MTKIEKTLRELSDLHDFYTRIQKAKADGGRKKGAAAHSTRKRGTRASG
jgi:hypothetical protein